MTLSIAPLPWLIVSEELSDHEAMKQIITQDIYYKCHEHIHKVKLV